MVMKQLGWRLDLLLLLLLLLRWKWSRREAVGLDP
jgi:hypothetical protein